MCIHPKSFILSTECFTTCPRLFSNILSIFREHSLKYLATFPGIFHDITRNVWWHSPECHGMLNSILQNVWEQSPEFFTTFPGIFHDIPPESLKTFPEYNILPIPRVPRIPFLVPVFLVLHIAWRITWIYHKTKIVKSENNALLGNTRSRWFVFIENSRSLFL